MKNQKLLAKVLVASLALSTLFSFSANVDAASAPKLNVTKKTTSVGKRFTLSVKKTSGVKKIKSVSWKSSKASVASVKKAGATKATVTTKAHGSATIKATVKYLNKKKKSLKKTLSCKITVIKSGAPAPNSSTNAPTTSTEAPKSTQAPTSTPLPTATPRFDGLTEVGMKDVANYLVGTVCSYDGKNSIHDSVFTQVAAQQFDIISFENETKGYSLLDEKACQAAAEKDPKAMPVCKFEQADEMVQWAADNGLHVRGHVLIWEASMLDSFFHEGYNSDKPLVDAETLKARMQSYCMQVVTHFEKKFPGRIICWDVVNEAIDAGGSADPTTGLYLLKSGNFYKILGGEYIKYAFQYAKEATEEAKKIAGNDILLYYNDYNTFQSPKTDRICKLIDYLNSDPDHPLLDCMGMEGYVLPSWPNSSDIKSAMEKYAAKGVKIGINELCVRLNRDTCSNKKVGVTDKDVANNAKRAADLYKTYTVFDKAHPGVLTNVSIWGLMDHPELEAEYDKPENERNYDFTVYGTHSGLFDYQYYAKDAFFKVIDAIKANS